LDKLEKGKCTKCGLCMASCPVWTHGTPSIVSVLNEASEEGAWHCVNCWRCMEACPSDVDIYGFMMAKRKEEEAPRGIEEGLVSITGKGCSMNIRGLNEIRETYGLRPVKLLERDKVRVLLEENPS
jgi:heterodisulfide reductase subunit C